jgi:hypothetical protein
MKEKSITARILFSLFLFSTLGGLYIIGSALIHPQTLPIQLSHLTPWIREDTFGIMCWIISFISFISWNIIRD